MFSLSRVFYVLIALVMLGLSAEAVAQPWVGPGDMRLRNDLQLLVDSGELNVPLTAWPVAWADVHFGLAETAADSLSPAVRAAFERVRQQAREEMDDGSVRVQVALSGASNPRIIRAFDDLPRDEGEAMAGLAWVGQRFAVNLSATYVDDPLDGDEVRPDGTYVGVAMGNWMLSAGWQERWWGPGRDGSMILSTNARPMPAIGIQRNLSTPSDSKWFSWMGPWTLTSHMGLMDDERVIDNGLYWGMRGSFRPLRGLEIGLSRAAQWCGDNRPCNLKTFLRVLNGNDNQGANVDPEDEPGNQLGGIDVRWSLPRDIPVALYMQWTAEDTRRTGAQLHQWLEQVGVEFWGSFGALSHRTHLEIANSSCHRGALGEGSQVPNCAYENAIFESGYRYNGRPIGHGMDGDGLSWSLGSTLVQPEGHTWNISLRHIDINRIGPLDDRHSLTPTPQTLIDVQVSHERLFRFGRIHLGISYSDLSDEVSGVSNSEAGGFIRWRSR